MKLTVLGTGTAIPQKERTTPGYLLSVDQNPYLFDMGPLAVHRLMELNIDLASISTVFISHYHLDHILGLFHLLFVFKHPEYKKIKAKVKIAGSSESILKITKIIHAFGNMIEPESYSFEILGPSKKFQLSADYYLLAATVSHNNSSLAYMIFKDDKKIFVYTGDSDYDHSVIDAASGTQFLLMECSFPDQKKVANHLIPSQCAQIAFRSRAKMTLLTHFYPEAQSDLIEQQCSQSFVTDYLLLKDGQIIDLTG